MGNVRIVALLNRRRMRAENLAQGIVHPGLFHNITKAKGFCAGGQGIRIEARYQDGRGRKPLSLELVV